MDRPLVTRTAAYLRCAERNRRMDEARHDRTRQRAFERAFESRDLPFSRASRADAGDGGRGARQVRNFDRAGPSWYETSIRSAAARLPKPFWHLRGLLVNLYRYRGDKTAVKAATWPGEDPKSDAVRVKYCQGVKKLLNFFSGP